MNLSPGQSYVHLYCALDRPESADDDETGRTCNVFFLCGQRADRDPVSWEVTVYRESEERFFRCARTTDESAGLRNA